MPVSMREKLRCERGTSAVDLALVLFAALTITVGIFDFGLATWSWFATQKATQMGVRFAVDNDPVAANFSTFNAVTALGIQAPTNLTLSQVSAFTVRCTSNGTTATCTCQSGTCTKGGHNFTQNPSNAAFNSILNHMRTMTTRIKAENLVVDYSHVGLGFAGRPGLQLVPQVTVSVQNMNYGFFALDAFVPVPSIIPMDGFDSAMTAEDLDSQG